MTTNEFYCCSFCGKTQNEINRLIAGPGAVYICNECVSRYRNTPHDKASLSTNTSQPSRCSFCGMSQNEVAHLVLGPGAVYICNNCLDLCQKIFEEENKLNTLPDQDHSQSSNPSRQKRNTRMKYRCSFCGKNQNEVKRLIAGPVAVFICNECVDLCAEILEEDKSPISPVENKGAQTALKYKGTRLNETKNRCSFCGNSEPRLAKLIAGPGSVFICTRCVELCQEILDDKSFGTEE